jgi:uracil-DNA glycosylase
MGKAGSPWEDFTDEVIRVLVTESAKSNKGLVFLLWGKPASAKAQAIPGVTNQHTIICTSHPSPLGATKTNSPFLGSKCFSRANDALKGLGMEPIDWNVDGELKLVDSHSKGTQNVSSVFETKRSVIYY